MKILKLTEDIFNDLKKLEEIKTKVYINLENFLILN